MKTGIFKNILLAVMLLLAMMAELIIGSIGWILPLTLPVFYFLTLNTVWYAAGFAAVAAGIILDLALGRTFPVSIPALLVMTLAAYQLRRPQPSELPEVLGSIAGSVAGAEAVYAVFATSEYSWGLLLQWLILSAAGIVLTIPVILIGRFLLEQLALPDCFTPRSALWKKHRMQSGSSRGKMP